MARLLLLRLLNCENLNVDKKHCYACNENKSVDDFAVNLSRADGRNSMCKACKKTYNAAYYQSTKPVHNPGRATRNRQESQRVRRLLTAYLQEHPCVDCGESDIVVLQFDHLGDKEANVSQMVKSRYSWARILREIKKCEVVCANDHARRTARAFGWFKSLPGERPELPDAA